MKINQKEISIEHNDKIGERIKLTKKVAALEALHRISIAMSSTLKLDELLNLIVAEAATLLNAQSCSILLPDQKTGDLIFCAAVDPVIGMRVPEGKGIVARVLRTGIPEIVNDVSLDPDYYAQIEQDSSQPIRTLMAIPLQVKVGTIGVLETTNKQGGEFTEHDRDLLVTMASHAAIAIENARLVGQLQQNMTALQQRVDERTAELQKLYKEMRKLAVTDELTGVFNRRGLFDLGEREVNRVRRFGHALSVVMFDLDYFKQINDSHGHAIGDQVLRAVAQRCSKSIREVDIFGRYGGDEFVVLLPETEFSEARKTAERLRHCVADQPVSTDKGVFSITISLGVHWTNGERAVLSSLFNEVDKALYLAKQAGRDCVRTTNQTITG